MASPLKTTGMELVVFQGASDSETTADGEQDEDYDGGAVISPKVKGLAADGSEKRKRVSQAATTKTATKRRRTTVQKKTSTAVARKATNSNIKPYRIAIPKTYEEATPADKNLLDRRDAGIDWDILTKEYKELAGIDEDVVLAKATLPNRYTRMKDKFAVMRAEDEPRLFAAKQQVEEQFEQEKWDQIGDVIASQGGKSYPADILRRRYKKIMERGNMTNVAAAHDPDFESE